MYYTVGLFYRDDLISVSATCVRCDYWSTLAMYTPPPQHCYENWAPRRRFRFDIDVAPRNHLSFDRIRERSGGGVTRWWIFNQNDRSDLCDEKNTRNLIQIYDWNVTTNNKCLRMLYILARNYNIKIFIGSLETIIIEHFNIYSVVLV